MDELDELNELDNLHQVRILLPIYSGEVLFYFFYVHSSL